MAVSMAAAIMRFRTGFERNETARFFLEKPRILGARQSLAKQNRTVPTPPVPQEDLLGKVYTDNANF